MRYSSNPNILEDAAVQFLSDLPVVILLLKKKSEIMSPCIKAIKRVDVPFYFLESTRVKDLIYEAEAYRQDHTDLVEINKNAARYYYYDYIRSLISKFLL